MFGSWTHRDAISPSWVRPSFRQAALAEHSCLPATLQNDPEALSENLALFLGRGHLALLTLAVLNCD